jgi:hypothetical protein
MSIIIIDTKPYWFIRVLNRKVNMINKKLTKWEKQMLKLLMSYHKKFDCFGNTKTKRKTK